MVAVGGCGQLLSYESFPRDAQDAEVDGGVGSWGVGNC